jgi:hypothetical protein
MAVADGGGEQLHGLLGELLPLRDAFGRSQRPRLFNPMRALFAIDLIPLGLVTGLEKRFAA